MLSMFQSIVRFSLNRFACLLLLALFFVSAIWWSVQVVPIVSSSFKQEELFFGLPHKAKQSPFFGRVIFEINDDDKADFMVWMNPANRARFDQWFGPDQGLKIEAVRALKNTWVVVGLESTEGGLDRNELTMWRAFAGLVSLAITFVFTVITFWLGKQYKGYFRYRPWFRRKP